MVDPEFDSIGPAKAVVPGFGTATAVGVIASSMIGVGVLTTSGRTVLAVGGNGPMLGLWLLGGVLALCGALSLAEVSASLPRSGGEYAIFRAAYGEWPAFLVGWVTFQFGFSAPIAATASMAADYLLAPFGLDPSMAAVARPGVGSALIVAIAGVHASGRGRSVALQGAVTVAELVFLVAFVVAGLVAGSGHLDHLRDPPTGDGRSWSGALLALVYVSYSYTGWNAASYLAGEVADAPRRLPRAIGLGTGLVTALYLGLNLVYALALPANEVHALARLGGDAAVDLIARLAADRLFGPRWGDRLAVVVGLVLVANLSVYLLTGPRVLVAMARSGQFFARFGHTSGRTGTPTSAIALQAGWSLVLLATGSFDAIVVYAGVGLAIASTLAVAATVVLRIRQPDLPRPFRVPGYPLTPALFIAANLTLLAAVAVEQPKVAALSTLAIALGIPLRWLVERPVADLAPGEPAPDREA